MASATHPSPFFNVACKIVETQEQAAARAFTGVSWSALSPRPPKVETVDEVVARLEADAASAMAFDESPRGRFARAAKELWSLGYEAELRAIQTVYLACERCAGEGRQDDLSPGNIARAIRVLNGISHSTAREAITALCDLIVPSLKEAA